MPQILPWSDRVLLTSHNRAVPGMWGIIERTHCWEVHSRCRTRAPRAHFGFHGVPYILPGGQLNKSTKGHY